MFSVIIPVYNHSLYLREAVISALRSELVKEVLICDDGSKDASADLCAQLASEFQKKVFDYSDKPSRNIGAHNRLNNLCRLSKQPWIRVLNSDDFFLPGTFETIRLLASTQSANCISGSMLICDETSQIKGTKKGLFDPEYPLPIKLEPKPIMYNEEVRRFLLNQNFIATTSNMAFTRNLFDRIGGFRDFRYSHDLDFALRATMHGVVIHTAAYLVAYRAHSSNTISEVSPHMDGEILRLYSSFLHDFPNVEEDPEILQLLDHNRHIIPFPRNPRKKNVIGLCNVKSNICKFSENFPKYARPNALLALCSLNYDFVIVTNSLNEQSWPLAAENISGFATSNNEMNILFPRGEISLDLRGRIIRCPIPPCMNNNGSAEQFKLLGDLKNRIDGMEVLVGTPIPLERKMCPTLRNQLSTELVDSPNDLRPIVYVIPIFLAVGGVERNTIEVIRLLRDRYRFVVITTERLTKPQGSLHWQLYEMSIPVVDLAEIAPQMHHLDLLTILAQITPPDLVWICNGSPWLVENISKIRRLFADIPIIDQEVYDTNEGWINHYHEKGIQSLDFFIAINSRIKADFINRFRIPSQRVKLIYSILSEEKVLKARKAQEERNDLRKQLGISPKFSKVFVSIGRLTNQKNPLSFLKIAKYAMQQHRDCFFIQVGDGELNSECESYIKSENINNVMRIHYHPSTPELDAIADGMIITSAYEGLPIAMLEALGVGIPVLATDVGDIRSVLERHRSGHLFDNIEIDKNIELSHHSFTKFIEDHHILQQAAMAARDQIISDFGTNKISKQYEDLFSSAIVRTGKLL